MNRVKFIVITSVLICGCLLVTGIVLKLFLSLQQDVIEENDKMIHEECILMVDGKESQNARYVSINMEEKYAMIPLVPVLEELGIPVKWTGKNTAVIDVYGDDYYLNTKNITLSKGVDGPSVLGIPAGTTHGMVTDWINGVLTIDDDTLYWFVNRLIGARISVDYSTATVSIYFYK